MQLRELGVDLEQEDVATGFLGVMLERDPETSLLKMKQTGLIKRIIEALGLDDGAKGKFTPSESKPLVKDINGDLASGAFSYSLQQRNGYAPVFVPTSLLLSIVVLVICSALNICTS